MPKFRIPDLSRSPLAKATFESSALSAISNIAAQSIQLYKGQRFGYSVTEFSHFLIIALLTAPPNYYWQLWLERRFPTYRSRAHVPSASTLAMPPMHHKRTDSRVAVAADGGRGSSGGGLLPSSISIARPGPGSGSGSHVPALGAMPSPAGLGLALSASALASSAAVRAATANAANAAAAAAAARGFGHNGTTTTGSDTAGAIVEMAPLMPSVAASSSSDATEPRTDRGYPGAAAAVNAEKSSLSPRLSAAVAPLSLSSTSGSFFVPGSSKPGLGPSSSSLSGHPAGLPPPYPNAHSHLHCHLPAPSSSSSNTPFGFGPFGSSNGAKPVITATSPSLVTTTTTVQHPAPPQPSSLSLSLNIRHIILKFLLDALLLGALFNTVLFLVLAGVLKGHSGATVWASVRADTVPIIVTGFRIWPVATVVNFTLVPPHRRIVFFSVVGLVWGVYLSLVGSEL